MFFEENDFDKIIEMNEKKIRDIESQIDSLSTDMNKLFKELSMSPETLSSYLGNPDNFSEEMWEHLQEERQKLEERLQKKLDHIRNPLEADKAYRQRNLPHYAIFCK